VVGCITVETLEGTSGVCTEEVMLPSFRTNEQKILVYNTQFKHTNSVETIQPTGKNLVFTDKGTTSQTINKRVISVNHSVVQICEQ
jgi:hypothetical protein